ncbi:MAG: LptF/LptG family permease [Alphaproteobacteria bacterium]|nr:MAG: LptF/LptG family permease [Alphaproteobacteria bacterium]
MKEKLNLFILYIFRQLFGPFILIMITMTGIAWLTQSLRFIDLIVIKGLPLNIFINLTILIIPKLLVTIIPFIGFLASLITYIRLNNESELISMKSAGINNFKIVLPALIFGISLGALSMTLENFASPYAYNKFKNLQYDIRNNYISILFQDKVFSSPIQGLTIFIKERDKLGDLQGILIHDARDKNKKISIIAEQGKIVSTPKGARFLLINGNRQEISKNKDISILYFNQYTLNVENYSKVSSSRFKEASERNFYELLKPDKDIDEIYKKEFIAEAHKRIISPLIIVIMVLLGAVMPIAGRFERKKSVKKIFYPLAAALMMQIYIIVSPQMIIKYQNITFIIYILVFIIFFLVLFFISNKAKKIKDKLLYKYGVF